MASQKHQNIVGSWYRLRDRLRKNVFKFGRESDTLKYKKQRNKVNNMKKKAKTNFESNLDNILLDNSIRRLKSLSFHSS
jgi:hypothetical protein